MRYFVRIQYDGSKFYGFQRQKDKISVQGELERVISILNKRQTFVKGAGRTDVGVHANGQGVHFDLDFSISEERLQNAINHIISPYIKVISCERVSNDFHARFQVVQKKYVYKIWLGESNPFLYDYYLFYEKALDIDKLEKCSELFLGAHNFHNFVSGVRDNYDAVLYSIDIQKKDQGVDIIFTGKSFYRYMVRNLVGAMLDYNEGKCDWQLLEKMVNDVAFDYQLRTAPAKGLYLEGIDYES